MELLTYKQIKEKANLDLDSRIKEEIEKVGIKYEPIIFSQKDVILWAKLNRYKKKRIQINGDRNIYYIKENN
jgi:hypothetical protein